MNIVLLCVGKTQEAYLREGIREYEQRLQHYISFKRIELPDIKNTGGLTIQQIKEKEGLLLLKNVGIQDCLVLFDENGTTYSSKQMSFQIEQHLSKGTKSLLFSIGGAYGFSPQVYERAQAKWSLSALTLPHQLVRLLCVEQIYRCFTIIRGEAYHHV